MRWITPSYTKIHEVLSNPVYAGAYVYGKTRYERYVDDTGRVRKRVRLYLAPSGRSSFVTITGASSTGRPSRPISYGWRKTPIRGRTRLEER